MTILESLTTIFLLCGLLGVIGCLLERLIKGRYHSRANKRQALEGWERWNRG